MTVWIYVDTSRQVGDRDRLRYLRPRSRPRFGSRRILSREMLQALEPRRQQRVESFLPADAPSPETGRKPGPTGWRPLRSSDNRRGPFLSF
jgi:hypothetical protein